MCWPAAAPPLARELELQKYGGCILSYNGGKIIDCKTGHVLVQHAFPPDLIEPVCTFSRYWNVVPLTYDTHGIITENASSPYVQEEARINKIPVRQVENLPATVNYPINKLLLTGDGQCPGPRKSGGRLPDGRQRPRRCGAGCRKIYLERGELTCEPDRF